jgi:FAD/FMN-containing dehydrogenase
MPYRPNQRILASARRIAEWETRLPTDLKNLEISYTALCELERKMRGNLVLPGSAGYDESRQLANPAFQHYPQVIAYCEVSRDVQLCLEFAHAQSLWIACRAGGHSFGGYSVNSGMVIDVSRMNSVDVIPGEQRVRVGAGTSFGHLNAILDEYGLHVPGGACEDVCVAGYMQGGGYGYTSRRFGMHCDNVTAFRMMLRDGRVVTASEERNPDLFWAVRGGTGGNFGVLLDITYRTHELGPVWAFGWVWDIDDAPSLLIELQKGFMKAGAPRDLGYMASMAEHENQKVFAMQGIYVGTGDDGRAALAPLKAVAQPKLEVENTGSYDKMNEWADSNPYPMPGLPDTEVKEAKQAGYIARPLGQDDWASIVGFFKSSPSAYNTVVIEPYGGAINDYPEFGNAFVHRDVDMDLFVDVFWIDDDDKAEAIRWLDDFMDLMEPFYNGHVYQNYPRDTLKDYRSMYFGAAFDALLHIKNKYDPPPYFFHYQQSIKPYDTSDQPGVKGYPDILERFGDDEIVCD